MERENGYRGLWFELGQKSAYGDKYSGGLGTYTAKHVPLAVYSPQAHKTFFVWGSAGRKRKCLLAMVSYYDHHRGLVARPAIVHEKPGVDDPHDNPSISIDGEGHVWVFVSGRGRARDGLKYRSRERHSVDAFDLVEVHRGMTYPQPWYVPGGGLLLLFTMYTAGRELYWQTSEDGLSWSETRKLAGFGGHYQVSWRRGQTVCTAFNWHPEGNVDRRTNLYFLQSDDMGRTWRTASGQPVRTPLASVDNPALVHDYRAEGSLVYLKDLSFDTDGTPVILHVTSSDHRPGPQDPPRAWVTARWNGCEWECRPIAPAGHNYDMGSLHIEPNGTWRLIAPTEPGPQKWGAGGEMAMWTSRNRGRTWRRLKQLTAGSERNHNYARRPVNAHPRFYAFWADGDTERVSDSFLYFATKNGMTYMLPPRMRGDFARPIRLR